MRTPFDTTIINGMSLPNRFFRSATWEGLANDDGSVTEKLIHVMRALAAGGVGLIISGHTYISREGQTLSRQLGIYSNNLIPGLAAMSNAVHGTGGKIALQLTHAGSYALSNLTGLEPIGPSPVFQKSVSTGREMTYQDIDSTIQVFADAAKRAQEAGFDAIQLHGAHGYLLNQFLSPYFNKRSDNYGGTIENRVRFVIEIVQAIRDRVGPAFPILIKLNSEDFLHGGATVDDMFGVASILDKTSIDCIEMSGGTFLSHDLAPPRKGKPDSGEPEAYYEKTARLWKEKICTPLALVGGIRSFETAERIIQEGTADYISLSRPFIREPALINRWKSGDRRRALCVSDNGCFRPGFQGKGVFCTVAARGEGYGK